MEKPAGSGASAAGKDKQMSGLSHDDVAYLQQAIGISRHALEDEGKTPFGALVVVGGEVVGEGTSSVMELVDPTAHAEVMALRHAAAHLGRHLLEDGVMYTSSEPCPMCLAACYWARLPRLVFAATSHDVAANGFEDLQLCREMARPAEARSLQEDAAGQDLRAAAAGVLQAWAAQLPHPIEPKF
jgi:guanine deaminase